SRTYDVIHVNQGHCYLAANEHRSSQRHGVFICRSHGLDDRAERVLSGWRRVLGIPKRPGWKRLPGVFVDRALSRHDRLAYRSVDGVLVSCSNDANYLKRHHELSDWRIGCVPQAPADEFVATDASSLGEERLNRLLHVGGLAYWKGVHAIAAAVNRILATNQKAEMTWVCREEEHAAARSLLEPDLQGRVELEPWMSQRELMEVYDQHGIFLYPSLFEGFGKAFIEAKARGLCVVGTPEGGMPDVIEDGKDGVLVGFNRPNEIAAAVYNLWADPDHAVAMSENAAKTARSYSWRRVAVETASFYERLILGQKGK
ncbi:MAG: glycosyltransferase family 4 protein, partial [Arenicellales bacterium]